MKWFRHGSYDSLDKDVFFVVDKLSDVKQENKVLCDSLSKEFGVNGNIITIENGFASGCYKGSIDEIQNGILSTFHLHDQAEAFDCPVSIKVDRDIHMKMLRVLRGILSQCSRTEFRLEIKKALHSDNIFEKLDILKAIDISKITDFGKNKADLIEVRKFMAFQIIQFLGLVHFPQIEIYTKSEASKFYSEATCALYRSDWIAMKVIKDLQEDFIQACYHLLDSKKTINILQDGKLLRTQIGRLDVKTEIYKPEE